MIAIQKIGKSFMGALNYNLKKLQLPDPQQRAKLLYSSFASQDKAVIRSEIEFVRSLKPGLNRYVYHTSLNFSKEEQLSDDKLLRIARDYLQQSGYTNNQYMVFRHQDADHPHLHLLVNRICFDGTLVSDSNNYKKSEAILRGLEEHYNLITVEPQIKVNKYPDSSLSPQQSNRPAGDQLRRRSAEHANNIPEKHYNDITQRAPTREEIEMALRTGKPSEKMLLQEMMKELLGSGIINIGEMIRKGEQMGIHFLFNQAATGRVSGITYFHNDFRIKGQALGNSFKWAELIKYISYEQARDSAAISAANSRTKALNGESAAGNNGRGGAGLSEDTHQRTSLREGQRAAPRGDQEGPTTDQGNTATADRAFNDDVADDLSAAYSSMGVEIIDDIDDEALLGKNRRRQGKPRTNRR